MGAASLAVDGPVGWLHLALGVAVLLLPGIAAADRIAPRWRLRWVLAPVLAATILMLSAVTLAFLVGLPVAPWATVALSIAWTTVLQRRRLLRWATATMRRVRSDAPGRPGPNPLSADTDDDDEAAHGPAASGLVWDDVHPGNARSGMERRERVGAWEALGLAAVVAVLLVMHSVPHLAPEGSRRMEAGASDLDGALELAARTGAALAGDDYPYPVHVDEHVHIARAAAVAREGTPFIGDPYTGQPGTAGLFDLQGEVHERGFWTLLAQVHGVTGLALPALARFLPAIWAACLGATLWATLRPAPGALVSAAFLSILPATPLFLGTAYLVPITFGLAWVLAVLAVVLRSDGLVRLFVPLGLITGAFFIHLVAGGLAILAGILAWLLRPGPWPSRLSGAVLLLLPLAWIWPAIRNEVNLNLGAAGHPTESGILWAAGYAIPALAIAGILVALRRRDALAHRVLAALGLIVLAGILATLASGHTSLALYFRPVHAFLLCAAALAGLGVGATARGAQRLARRIAGGHARGATLATGALVVGVALAFVLPAAARAHLQTGQYHLFDEASWSDLEAFAAAEPEPGAVFLADPWRAPLFNAATGAIPYTVLYPGSGPTNGAASEYEVLAGASPAWFEERGITWVVMAAPPNATILEEHGANVYLIAP